MASIRPPGAGSSGTALPFVRVNATPVAALVIASDTAVPMDWEEAEADTEANIGFVPGYACEVRRSDLVVVNPLGEGVIKASLPDLNDEWVANVRHEESCVLFLVPTGLDTRFPELAVAEAADQGRLHAATIRTAIDAAAFDSPTQGRNEPCACGSGKKFKHCHGKA